MKFTNDSLKNKFIDIKKIIAIVVIKNRVNVQTKIKKSRVYVGAILIARYSYEYIEKEYKLM